MRKREKEITNRDEIERILAENTVCRIALADDEMPYLVPMNYGYAENTIYLHSSPSGKKMEIIKRNNRVCFEVTDSVELKTAKRACSFSTCYRSVIGFGRVFPIIPKDQKAKALRILMRQHTGKDSWAFTESALDTVTVMEIRIETMHGKMSS